MAVSEIPTNRRLEWSVRRLADELGCARETVQKRIAEYGIKPVGTRSGNPTYLLKDVFAAFTSPMAHDEDAPDIDPRKLRPIDRRAWYQSESERMAVEVKARQLIPAIEVYDDFAEQTREFVQFLDTLPDQLERDVSMSAEQVEAMNKAIAKQRLALYAKLVSEHDMEEAQSA